MFFKKIVADYEVETTTILPMLLDTIVSTINLEESISLPKVFNGVSTVIRYFGKAV